MSKVLYLYQNLLDQTDNETVNVIKLIVLCVGLYSNEIAQFLEIWSICSIHTA